LCRNIINECLDILKKMPLELVGGSEFQSIFSPNLNVCLVILVMAGIAGGKTQVKSPTRPIDMRRVGILTWNPEKMPFPSKWLVSTIVKTPSNKTKMLNLLLPCTLAHPAQTQVTWVKGACKIY